MFVFNSFQASSNLIFLKNLMTIRPSIQFHPKIRASRKVLNFVLLDYYFSNLFTEVKSWYLKTFRLSPGRFFKKIKLFLAEISLFLTIKAVHKDIKPEKKLQTRIDVMISEFLILHQFFFSVKVKQCKVFSNKHGTYELHHKLLSDVRVRTWENYERPEKSQNIIELYPSAWLSIEKKFVETSKKLQKNGNYNFSHSALFHIKLEFFKNIFSMVVFGSVFFGNGF